MRRFGWNFVVLVDIAKEMRRFGRNFVVFGRF
jgi:hypothetical protein